VIQSCVWQVLHLLSAFGHIPPHNDNMLAVMTAGNCNVGTVEGIHLQKGLATYWQWCRCISQGKQKNSIRSHQVCLE